ncbi:MAG: hypothetical protein RPR97_17565 [Colwellia sp.]
MNSAVIQSKQGLLRATIIAFMPVIKKSVDASRVKSFDKKLQRSYFLVGKK